MLGGDKDYTVGTLATIDSRLRGILEYRERLHVLHVDFVQVTLKSVDQDEGR